MKNVSKTFTGVFGLAAGFIIGAVWSGWENQHNNVELVKYQKHRPAISNECTKVLDVIFYSFDDACDILDQINDAITEYGAVSVAEFYDMVGVTPNYADYKCGWYNTDGGYRTGCTWLVGRAASDGAGIQTAVEFEPRAGGRRGVGDYSAGRSIAGNVLCCRKIQGDRRCRTAADRRGLQDIRRGSIKICRGNGETVGSHGDSWSVIAVCGADLYGDHRGWT